MRLDHMRLEDVQELKAALRCISDVLICIQDTGRTGIAHLVSQRGEATITISDMPVLAIGTASAGSSVEKYLDMLRAQGEGLSERPTNVLQADPRSGKSDPDHVSLLGDLAPAWATYMPTAADAVAASEAAPDEETPAVLPAAGDVTADPIPAVTGGGGDPGISAPAVPEVAPPAPAPVAAAGSSWTAEDDQRLIDLAVSRMADHGMAKMAAITAAAADLGRGAEACKFRIYKPHMSKLFDIALAKAKADKNAPTSTPIASSPAPAEVPPPTSVLDAYLWGLPRDGKFPWSWADDAELMRQACLGYTMGSIAADLGLDSAQVKSRFDLLTGHHKDKDDRWQRQFAREDVLAALDAHIARNPGV